MTLFIEPTGEANVTETENGYHIPQVKITVDAGTYKVAFEAKDVDLIRQNPECPSGRPVIVTSEIRFTSGVTVKDS